MIDDGLQRSGLQVLAVGLEGLRKIAKFQTVAGITGARGSVVVEALRYKPEGRGFETRCFQCI
jgi:hypothetical protein